MLSHKVAEPTLPSNIVLLTICMVEIWICGIQLHERGKDTCIERDESYSYITENYAKLPSSIIGEREMLKTIFCNAGFTLFPHC